MPSSVVLQGPMAGGVPGSLLLKHVGNNIGKNSPKSIYLLFICLLFIFVSGWDVQVSSD